MKITARQLKVEDTMKWNGCGVTRVDMIKDSNGKDAVAVEYITPAGYRYDTVFAGNHIMTVDRASVDGTDPLARPYWYGLEAEKEREDDAAAYANEPQ